MRIIRIALVTLVMAIAVFLVFVLIVPVPSTSGRRQILVLNLTGREIVARHQQSDANTWHTTISANHLVEAGGSVLFDYDRGDRVVVLPVAEEGTSSTTIDGREVLLAEDFSLIFTIDQSRTTSLRIRPAGGGRISGEISDSTGGG
ncbi:MAG: hypothetical protein ACI89L_001426 [Phycisphaerales bacterium]|jgi:hypothetical protein